MMPVPVPVLHDQFPANSAVTETIVGLDHLGGPDPDGLGTWSLFAQSEGELGR